MSPILVDNRPRIQAQVTIGIEAFDEVGFVNCIQAEFRPVDSGQTVQFGVVLSVLLHPQFPKGRFVEEAPPLLTNHSTDFDQMPWLNIAEDVKQNFVGQSTKGITF